MLIDALKETWDNVKLGVRDAKGDATPISDTKCGLKGNSTLMQPETEDARNRFDFFVNLGSKSRTITQPCFWIFCTRRHHFKTTCGKRRVNHNVIDTLGNFFICPFGAYTKSWYLDTQWTLDKCLRNVVHTAVTRSTLVALTKHSCKRQTYESLSAVW